MCGNVSENDLNFGNVSEKIRKEPFKYNVFKLEFITINNLLFYQFFAYQIITLPT